MFTATIEGAQELATRWVQVRAAIRAGLRRGVAQGVREGAAEARSRHLFTNRTGRLERSIVGRVLGSRTSVGASRSNNGPPIGHMRGETKLDPNDGAHFGEIVADAKNKDGVAYPSFVEGGTRGGTIIRPLRAKVLRWFDPPGSGNAVFARKVRRGATRPHPFMSFAYFKCERVMIRELERGVAQAQAVLDR